MTTMLLGAVLVLAVALVLCVVALLRGNRGAQARRRSIESETKDEGENHE